MRRTRSSLLALLVVVAGCGGDDKPSSTVDRAPTISRTTPQDVPAAPAPTTPTETTPAKPPPPTSTSPEDQPGGGGDEEPARTEVTLNATSAGVRPRHANVAPYIAVRITLVSKDGSDHTLTIDGRTLRVGGTRKSAFFELSGLGPGRAYNGRTDSGETIRILSASEPGP